MTDYIVLRVKEAGCTTTGQDRYTWANSAYGTFSFLVEVPALGHNYTAKETSPTCTESGFTTYTCVCGDSYTADQTPATGNHIYENGVCTGCQMPKLKFTGANLSLQTNLAIGYAVSKDLVAAYDSVYAKCVMNGYETDVVEYVEADGNCYFYFRGLSPMIIGDTVVAQIYGYKDGVEYRGNEKPYSIQEYCDYMLNTINSKQPLTTMLVDLLNYGTALQNFIGYKTNTPCNSILTETQKSWGTTNNRTLETLLNSKYEVVENPQVIWKGASLVLGEAVGICYTIAPNEGVDVSRLSLRVRMESGSVTVISGDQFILNDNGYYEAFFAEMNATQMSEAVYATICVDGVPVSNTVRYSVESYASFNQNANDTKLAELVKAMICYGDSAKVYAGKA
jgi:hypothetical protein